MKVLLVTTWNTPCGIAEHSAMLKESVEAADPSVTLLPTAEGLDPELVLEREECLGVGQDPIVHLNYHAALHSRWTPGRIAQLQDRGIKVFVTYHDTGVPNSDQCKGIVAAADCAVVHEPFSDLTGNVHYIRQGIPEWANPLYVCKPDGRSLTGGRRPVVGTVGFPFPWKSYELLCEASDLAGWGCLLIAPGATDAQEAGWRARNPELVVLREFVDRHQVVAMLSACDATAFLFSCANTGQSGSILQGVAARQPVLAFSSCRQMRALFLDPVGQRAVRWVTDGSPVGVAAALATVPISRVDAGVIALAHQDSWKGVGQRYAALYRQLAAS